MQGKVCLVTGATSGIGLATALGLARQRATVILVARNRERGASAVARIRDGTGNDAVEFLPADLSVQAEVRRLAREFQARYPRLDVLINNAGGIFLHRQENASGIEMTWALNVLAPFLLTNLLLESLRTSAPARIVNVSSIMHRVAGRNFQRGGPKRWHCGVEAYSRSKLALLLLTYELARRLDGSGLTANAANPGLVATNIISGNSGRFWALVQSALNPLFVSAEEGARASLYLASSPGLAQETGQYYKGERPVRSSRASHDEEAAQRLWRVCEEMVGSTGPEPRDTEQHSSSLLVQTGG
jgi:NAD(P)-dependent dehydrogenase (short-subunit alcohol dehydrogenase family)